MPRSEPEKNPAMVIGNPAKLMSSLGIRTITNVFFFSGQIH
jgi:hypothetical protein